ncbi:unnamed protein product, partial [Staurois parvus]
MGPTTDPGPSGSARGPHELSVRPWLVLLKNYIIQVLLSTVQLYLPHDMSPFLNWQIHSE